MLNLSVSDLITYAIVLVTAFSVHEFAHAWTANYFGDNTPRLYGRLTLNPLAHLDLVGSLMLIFAGIGWAKPVPVDPYALRRRSPAALMWVSAAGPLSNFFLAVLAAVPFRLGLVSTADLYSSAVFSLPMFLSSFVIINLSLMLFNLIPLAPLDGEKVFVHFLPPQMSQGFERIRPFGPMILLAVMFVGPMLGFNIFSYLVSYPAFMVYGLLVG